MNKYLLPLILGMGLVQANTDYFQQQVNYDIQVALDDSAHTLTAYGKIAYTNNSPDTLNFIWFHLWPNAYKNDSTAFALQQKRQRRTHFLDSKDKDRGYIDSLDFTINKASVEWEFHPDWIDVAKVHLPQPLVPGGSVTIETPFFVKLPEVFSRLGHSGKHYEITQWYPKPAVYDHKGWHSMPYLNQGEFYSEFGTFDVKITLPKDYRIMATGDLVNGDEEYTWLDSLAVAGDSLHMLSKKEFKKKIKALKKEHKKGRKKKDKGETVSGPQELKTLHFHQENVHDFAWFADKRWLVRKGNLLLGDSTRNITLWSFYLPKNAELWENSVEYLHDSGYWYSKFYGDYPYNHITAVDGDLSAGGGMEYPNITVISSGGSKDLLERVIMHEVGHNWFYGILGSNERDHTWMDEGLNSYTTIRYWQKKYADRGEQIIIQDFVQNKLGIAKHLSFGWLNYLQYVNIAKTRDVQPLNLTADDFRAGNYGQNYSKTAAFTRFLQHYLGEEKMDEIMQDFYETWKFRHPYPEDFQVIFKQHTDQDLSWYFDGVFNKTTYIDYGIRAEHDRFVITKHGTMDVPVEVVFYNREGKELRKDWVEGFQWQKVLIPPAGTTFAQIDPHEHMPDAVRANNSTRRKVRVNFVWDRPNYYDHELNIVPWLFSYNYYNGFTPGLMLFSGFTPGYESGISILTLYDFKHSKVVGGGYYSKTLGPIGMFHSASTSVRLTQLAGRRGGKLNFSGTLKKPLVRRPLGKLKTSLYFHDLDSTALDPVLYDSGQFYVGNLEYLHQWNPNRYLNYSLGAGVKIGNGFAKGNFMGNISYWFSKKINTKIRGWIGTFINAENIPLQYRTYLSGSIDPDFDANPLDRTGTSKWLGILNRQFIRNGPGLRGMVLDDNNDPLATTEFVWSFNMDQTLPYLPMKLFVDVSGGSEFKETFADAGIQLGPLFIPIYQSWESKNKTPDNIQWILNRLRLELSIDNPFSFID